VGRRGCGDEGWGKRQLRIPPDLAYGRKAIRGRFPERNPDLRRAVGRCEIERLRGTGLAARGRTDECFRPYALTTLPLRSRKCRRGCLGGGSHLSVNGAQVDIPAALADVVGVLMVLPNCGPLPQTSHTRAITLGSFQADTGAFAETTILQEFGGFRQGRKRKRARDRSAGSLVALAECKRCELGGLPHYRLRAVRTAAGVDGNLTQAFRALLGGRIGRSWSLRIPRNERIHRVTTKK